MFKLVVLLTAALSVAAIPSHFGRDSHYHREIAARVAQPEVAPVAEIAARDMPVPAKRLVRKKREDTDRCKQSNSGDVPLSFPKEESKPTSTPSEDPVATPKVDLKPTSTPAQNQLPKEDPQSTTSTPTPTPTPTPTSTPNPGTGGDTHTGEGTFYAIGMGACGYTSKEPELVAAISQILFDRFTPDGNPNHNSLCGKRARVTYKDKEPFEVELVDRCTGCKEFDLDFSEAAFIKLEPLSKGRISGVTWQIIN